ncbi:MAG: PLDc N-terminal domain-containing protein [Candidatus Aenigmatarchaeota archaeon]
MLFGFLAGMVFIAALALLIFIFWLWMLIDCLKRKKFEDKLVWILVLIFLNFIGALLYFFLVKSKR